MIKLKLNGGASRVEVEELFPDEDGLSFRVYMLVVNGRCPVKKFIKALRREDATLVAKLFRWIRRYAEGEQPHGHTKKWPHSKNPTLCYFRPDDVRMFFVLDTEPEDKGKARVLLINAFRKKQQKMPSEKPDNAISTYKNWKGEGT